MESPFSDPRRPPRRWSGVIDVGASACPVARQGQLLNPTLENTHENIPPELYPLRPVLRGK